MKNLVCLSVICTVFAIVQQQSYGDLLFNFQQVGNDVTMTSSGTFDTTGLQVVGPFLWGGVGIEENGNHDIMGGTSVGQVDTSFAFNAGTNFSQWASANGPWTSSDFSAAVTGGTKGFTTYVRDPSTNNQIPGLGIVRADMNGALWTTDQTWIWTNQTFASLNMIQGSYSVSDSVTGEKITYLIGIPEPSSLGVLGLGLGVVLLRRRSRK